MVSSPAGTAGARGRWRARGPRRGRWHGCSAGKAAISRAGTCRQDTGPSRSSMAARVPRTLLKWWQQAEENTGEGCGVKPTLAI